MVDGSEALNNSIDGYIVVPPLIKYAAGPLLGPAILDGAANAAGFRVRTVDLNIAYLAYTGLLPPPNTGEAEYFGDHCKPEKILDMVAGVFFDSLRKSAGISGVHLEAARMLQLNHEQAVSIAQNLVMTPLGEFLLKQLRRFARPNVLGISVMWERQVIPALFLSFASKKIWPNTLVVWGGAHVTALHDLIAVDERYGKLVDAYLPFQSEGSFLQLLETRGYSKCGWDTRPGQGVAMQAGEEHFASA